jgi:hypothetical protein
LASRGGWADNLSLSELWVIDFCWLGTTTGYDDTLVGELVGVCARCCRLFGCGEMARIGAMARISQATARVQTCRLLKYELVATTLIQKIASKCAASQCSRLVVCVSSQLPQSAVSTSRLNVVAGDVVMVRVRAHRDDGCTECASRRSECVPAWACLGSSCHQAGARACLLVGCLDTQRSSSLEMYSV